MFDYQAGEKYRLTLIMVGLAGLIAGVFLTVLLMPTPEPVKRRALPAYAHDPDVSGMHAGGPPAAGAAAAMAPQASMANPVIAKSLIEQWLPKAWDLSAGTAQQSQEQAMQYMTPECAQAYRQNIWTPEIAKQIDESGLKSSFRVDRVWSGGNNAEGAVIVFVDGEQVLDVPGKGANSRMVKLEYMVKQTPDGLRIAGISESGKRS